jgi:hypothetical protein
MDACLSKVKKNPAKRHSLASRKKMAKPRMAKSARKEEVNQAAGRAVRGKRMTWKYCIEEIMFGQPIENLEGQLNDLGGGGWEVVAAFPSPTPDAHGRVFVILKQPTKSK